MQTAEPGKKGENTVNAGQSIDIAREEEARIISDVAKAAISAVYPRYYPEEAVRFYLEQHTADRFRRDISEGKTYVIRRDDTIVGTGTIDDGHITRVFVLPGHQESGAGSSLMDHLEPLAARAHGCVWADVPLPAGEFFRKRRYVHMRHAECPVANDRLLSYEVMCKRDFDIDPARYNAPSMLVEKTIGLQGLDMDEVRKTIPPRVYLLADSLYDAMLQRNADSARISADSEIRLMNHNDRIGFAKGEMCSPGIATQAEDLFALGVQELIHVGFAGGRAGTRIGDYVVTDGAYHDTAVAGLYGIHDEIIETSAELTDFLCREMDRRGMKYHRGYHWTTDAGYVVPDWRIRYYEEKGVKCLEMEGAGLFTVARFRSRKAAGIYVVSDSGSGDDWDLGWGEEALERSVQKLIDAIAE